MRIELSFTKKVLLSVWVLILSIFITIYLLVIQEYKNTLLKEENSKIKAIFNSSLPIISVNLEFQIYSEITKEINNLVELNKQIIMVKVLDKNRKIVAQKMNNETKNRNPITKTEIIYNTTKNIDGYVELIYSNANYLSSVDNFKKTFFLIFILVIFIGGIFGKYLSSLFEPLRILTDELKGYNVEKNRKLHITYKNELDEISLINNTIVDMLKKIEEHTISLEEKVKEEVDKNLEKELRLYEQSKMAQMGEMIGNIAHQWRQPLSIISSRASGVIIKQDNNILKEDELVTNMDKIINATKFLSETIETFRNFIKEEKVIKKTTIQNVLNDSLGIVKDTLLNNHITIKNYIDYTKTIEITLVAGELQQVIINILNNAKDILIERNIKNAWIKIDLKENNDHLTIIIEDNAGGVPKDIISKIFDPYFTTKHKSQGTGLGLNMSYKIVKESLFGQLYVKNTENGACFYIELPLNKNK